MANTSKRTLNLANMQALMDQHTPVLPGPLSATQVPPDPSTEVTEVDRASVALVESDPAPAEAPRQRRTRSKSRPAKGEAELPRPGSSPDSETESRSGWALRQLKQRTARARSGPIKLVPGQMALPDEVYQAMREWILAQALEGQRYHLAAMLEVAAEQLPDDPGELIDLVHLVPERFTEPNVNQQRSFRLAPETAERLARVPMILRAAGYSKHAGRVHTALVLRFLADLGVTFDD